MPQTKEQKRIAAEQRNAAYQQLTLEQKRDKVANQPGNSTRQLKRLAREK